MPRIRSIGNRLYALLLSTMANRPVTDTASGMRVLRRSVLAELGPLPDGLHFTPAMSARAVLAGLPVVEIPMTYEERVGESKLHVGRDGWRFLQAILDGLLLFRPERLFWLLALVLGLGAAFLSVHPVEFFVANQRIEEWMIYRFVVTFLLGSAAALALSAAALVGSMAELVLGGERSTFTNVLLVRLFRGRSATVLALALAGGSFVLLWPGFREYFSYSTVSLHWSRVMVGAFGFLMAFQIALTALLLRVVTLWLEFAAMPEPGNSSPSA
jgi:hypothetical protein